eukprot:5963796-Pleurochrysis_carterae.AAC.2
MRKELRADCASARAFPRSLHRGCASITLPDESWRFPISCSRENVRVRARTGGARARAQAAASSRKRAHASLRVDVATTRPLRRRHAQLVAAIMQSGDRSLDLVQMRRSGAVPAKSESAHLRVSASLARSSSPFSIASCAREYHLAAYALAQGKGSSPLQLRNQKRGGRCFRMRRQGHQSC